MPLQDVTGEKLDILLVPSEDEMMAVQAHARAQAIPTHTFAGAARLAAPLAPDWVEALVRRGLVGLCVGKVALLALEIQADGMAG